MGAKDRKSRGGRGKQSKAAAAVTASGISGQVPVPAKGGAAPNQTRRPRSFEPRTTVADALDTLLRERYSGAVNIRGIRYQVRYAMLRAVEMAYAVRVATPPALAADAPRTASALPAASPPKAASTNDPLHAPLLRMEGIEDVDLADPSIGPLRVLGQPTHLGGEYVQVKTAASPWTWSKLKEPMVGWIELQRTAAAGVTYRLVVNFELTGDLSLLSRFRVLERHEQQNVRRKFRQLASKLGATDAEADAVLEALVIERLADDELRDRLRTVLTSAFDLVDEAALDAFELALTGRVLQWSEQRSVVRALDVLALGQALGEGLARQGRFQAIAHGLLGSVAFTQDATPDDFFAGRHTRLGHVVAGLDVRRDAWLRRVDAALARAGVCILRAPSGHGKSTLAFRYVYEHWPASQTLVVRSAQSGEEVAALRDYLQHRQQIGLPVRVLIDADYRTRLWPEVAAAAASVGAQVLVTVRTEDFQRYPLYALTRREILEPTLSDEEATRIFAEFMQRGHVASNVASAAWAYEQLRQPPLLLEYVYLLTHGQMLEDRLREQVHTMRALGEDPAKQDALRLVSLASALGAPVRLDALLRALKLRDDPQEVLRPLVDEYLVIEEGLVRGLHWVRSEHLARVLHDGGIPAVHETALRVLALVPPNALPFVIANALSWAGLDRTAFVQGLFHRYRDADTATLVSVLEGLFEAGEREFFAANRAPFDEAHARMGPDSLLLLWAETAPVLRAGTIDRMIEMLGEKAGGLPQYKAWAERVRDGRRGLDHVREFLQTLAASRRSEALQPDGAIGRLLDWCALTGVRLSSWSEARERFVEQPGPCALPIDDALDLVQGFHRYDPGAFGRWFAAHGDAWLACVQRHVRGLTLTLREPSSVTQTELARAGDPAWADGPDARALDPDVRRRGAEDAASAAQDAARHGVPSADVDLVFAVPPGTGAHWGDETRRHLDLLRRALPFTGRYFLQGDFLLPAGVVLPVDDTKKAVPRWNLPLPSDAAKNRTWGDVVARAYLPDGFYRYQERWAVARRAALRVVDGLNRVLTRALQGKPASAQRAFGTDGEALGAFETAFRDVPWLDARHFEALGQPLSGALAAQLKEATPNKWRNALQTFLRQLLAYLTPPSDDSAGRLAVVNFRDAAAALPGMHAFFAAMFADSPDYFDVRAIDAEERAAYDDLAVLLAGRITTPVSYPLRHPVSELREREARSAASDAAKIARALEPLAGTGRTIIPPKTVVPTGGLRAVAVGVDVRHIESPIEDLLPVTEALQTVAEVVDWFYLFPLRDGQRLSEGAYSLSAHRIRALERLDTWDVQEIASMAMSLMLPADVPKEVAQQLSSVPLTRNAPDHTIVQRAVGLTTSAEIYARRYRQIHAIGGATPLSDHLALRAELSAELEEIGAELNSLAATLRADVGLSSATDARARTGAEQLLRLAADVEALVVWASPTLVSGWPWTVEEVERAASAL